MRRRRRGAAKESGAQRLLAMADWWGSTASRTCHSDPECAELRRLVWPRLLSDEEVAVRRPCDHCFARRRNAVRRADERRPRRVVCTSCGDRVAEDKTVRFACDHSFCEECASSLSESCARRLSPLSCTCPREERGLAGRVPASVLDRYSASLPRGDEGAARPDEREWEEALNLRCPHCASVFSDFDGCASLQCSCGGHFCALCLEPFSSARESHEHVLVCPSNPDPGSYFVTASSYERVRASLRRRTATARALRYPNSLMRAGSSLEFARRGVPCSVRVLDIVRLPFEALYTLLRLVAVAIFVLGESRVRPEAVR